MAAPPFPIFLKLAGKPVLVVGAGPVACEKIDALVQARAKLRVVAPDISQGMLQYEAEGKVKVTRRAFTPSDLDGVWYVVAAAPPEINRAVSKAAEPRRIFVNAVDDKAAASAYLGAIVRRSDLALVISTGGRAPALAGLIRASLNAALDNWLPDDQTVSDWMDLGDELRKEWKAQKLPLGDRKAKLLDALIALQSDAGDGATRADGASSETGVPPALPASAKQPGPAPVQSTWKVDATFEANFDESAVTAARG